MTRPDTGHAAINTRGETNSSHNAKGWTLRPGIDTFVHSLRWAATLLVLFVVIYGGLNWLTAQRTDRLQLWFGWELATPFVPWMGLPYLSIIATFFLPMFVLDRQEIDTLCRRLVFATLASAGCFLLFPSELGFPRPQSVAGYEALFDLLHTLDLPYNLAPSLHVSWSLILLPTLGWASPVWLRIGFYLWLALLIASVVLVHQHHVLDVVGGMLVALAARILVASNGRWCILPRRAK